MQKSLYQILVPVNENEGEPFGKSDFDRWHSKCLEVAGGFTYLGEALGAWVPDHVKRDVGKIPDAELVQRAQIEPMRVYHVATDDPKAAWELAEWAASYFAQECTFLAQISARVDFVEEA